MIGLPIDVEYSSGMTIGALKEKLSNYIGELPLNQIFIITNRGCARKVFQDDLTVQKAMTQCPKVSGCGAFTFRHSEPDFDSSQRKLRFDSERKGTF